MIGCVAVGVEELNGGVKVRERSDSWSLANKDADAFVVGSINFHEFDVDIMFFIPLEGPMFS